MNEPLPVIAQGIFKPSTSLAILADEAPYPVRGSRSQATWRTYDSDWRDF